MLFWILVNFFGVSTFTPFLVLQVSQAAWIRMIYLEIKTYRAKNGFPKKLFIIIIFYFSFARGIWDHSESTSIVEIVGCNLKTHNADQRPKVLARAFCSQVCESLRRLSRD